MVEPFQIEIDAKLFMYLTQHNLLGSAHEKFGIWTVPNKNNIYY